MRVLGDVTEGDALGVLRDVDEVFIQTIREWGLYDRIWQAFAVFLPVRCALRSTAPQRSYPAQVKGVLCLHFLSDESLLRCICVRLLNSQAPGQDCAGQGTESLKIH